MIRDYFRTQRQLAADNDLQRRLLAEKDDQIRLAAEGLNQYMATMDARFADLRQAYLRVRRQLDEKRVQLTVVRGELEKLREEIAQLERGERPTFGMARYHDRPLVWQTADAINEDAAHVRREDI